MVRSTGIHFQPDVCRSMSTVWGATSSDGPKLQAQRYQRKLAQKWWAPRVMVPTCCWVSELTCMAWDTSHAALGKPHIDNVLRRLQGLSVSGPEGLVSPQRFGMIGPQRSADLVFGAWFVNIPKCPICVLLFSMTGKFPFIIIFIFVLCMCVCVYAHTCTHECSVHRG